MASMDVDLPYELALITTLTGHEDRAWHIAWNPIKPLLASCSSDKTVRMYSYTSTPSFDFQAVTSIPTGHTKTVRAVAWSPSGKSLATASFDSNIGIWEQEETDQGGGEWECLTLLEGHETECKSVAYSSTGTLLASCSRDKSVWVWEVQPDAEFECLGVMMEHSQDVKCVAWHPTEELLASASYDNTIKLYVDDPDDDWFCTSTLSGHSSTVWALSWSPCGRYLASGSDDRTVKIWEKAGSGMRVVTTLQGSERPVYSVSWGKGKSTHETSLGWLASTGSDGVVRVWDILVSEAVVSTKPIASVNNAHDVYDVNAVVWCPRDGYEDLLATAGDDGSTRIWRARLC